MTTHAHRAHDRHEPEGVGGMHDLTINGLHVGRSWEGNRIERECPCDNAPCGLAVSDTATDCPEHGIAAAKTLRQGHRAEDCPAAHTPDPRATAREDGGDRG